MPVTASRTVFLFGVSGDSRVVAAFRAAILPLIRLSCLSEIISRSSSGYLVRRSPSGVLTPLGFFRSGVPTFVRRWFNLPQALDPVQRPFERCLSALPMVPHRSSFSSSDGSPSAEHVAPPLRFSAPPAFEDQRIGCSSGSTRMPSPFDLSRILGGFILASPCGLVSCHCRSWGFGPSELFPACELSRARHPVCPSRRFLSFPKKAAASSGVFVSWQSASGFGVFHPRSDRCSPGLHFRFRGFPVLW